MFAGASAQVATVASPKTQLEQLSRKLQHLYSVVLATEKEFHPRLAGLDLLDKLINDPAWAWLRPLSNLAAEIDHVLAQSQPPTEYDHAVVAAQLRGLLAGEGDLANESFLNRYRPLLQLSPETRQRARRIADIVEGRAQRIRERGRAPACASSMGHALQAPRPRQLTVPATDRFEHAGNAAGKAARRPLADCGATFGRLTA